MAIEFERNAVRARYGLLLTALAPVIPQILGSAFNIWYNATVIEPMLTPALRQRFFTTVIVYNAVIYPIGAYLWLRRIFSFRNLFHRLSKAESSPAAERTPRGSPDAEELTQGRRRLIHLPWFAAAISGCLVLVHSGLCRRVASNSKSVGSTVAMAPANFFLSFRFHRGHPFVFPGGARQPVGIVPGFLS